MLCRYGCGLLALLLPEPEREGLSTHTGDQKEGNDSCCHSQVTGRPHPVYPAPQRPRTEWLRCLKTKWFTDWLHSQLMWESIVLVLSSQWNQTVLKSLKWSARTQGMSSGSVWKGLVCSFTTLEEDNKQMAMNWGYFHKWITLYLIILFSFCVWINYLKCSTIFSNYCNYFNIKYSRVVFFFNRP